MKKIFYALPISLIFALTHCTSEFNDIPSPEELFGGTSSPNGNPSSSGGDGLSSSSGLGEVFACETFEAEVANLCGGNTFNYKLIEDGSGPGDLDNPGCYFVKSFDEIIVGEGSSVWVNGTEFVCMASATGNKSDPTDCSGKLLEPISTVNGGYYIRTVKSDWPGASITGVVASNGPTECLNKTLSCSIPSGAIVGEKADYSVICGTTEVTSTTWSPVNLNNNLTEAKTFNDVKVTATCGGEEKTVSCYNKDGNSSIKVAPAPTCSGYTNLQTYCPGVNWFDIKWNTTPSKVPEGEGGEGATCYYVTGVSTFNTDDVVAGYINGEEYYDWNADLDIEPVDGGYYIFVPAEGWSNDFAGETGTKPACAN